jgi:hypothetical protein
MNAFIVEVENRPGTLAQVTEAVAAKGVNILVLTVAFGDRGAVAFVCNDEGGARSGLDEAGLPFRKSPVVLIGMEDTPGQSAAAARKLADAGVNIDFWMPVDTAKDRFTVAVGVDNEEVARQALSDQLTDWTYA